MSNLNLRHSRRRFLQGTAAAGGALAFGTGPTGRFGPSAAFAQDMARNETLYIGGHQ